MLREILTVWELFSANQGSTASGTSSFKEMLGHHSAYENVDVLSCFSSALTIPKQTFPQTALQRTTRSSGV
jgi:hypothetical protein